MNSISNQKSTHNAKLSIIIPAYNEENTILKLLNKIDKTDLGIIKKEIIIIDDGSTDNTKELLRNLKIKDIKVIYHKKNKGKGAAIRTALKHINSDIVLIQDADLEYDPKEYKKLINPILSGNADVVYGSRRLNKDNHYSYLSYYLGGIFLTWLTNFLYKSEITDQTTGYKAFKAPVIKNTKLECNGFNFCSEVTSKILRKGVNIVEVPISYHPRKIKEGKKVRFKDGITNVLTLIKYKFK